MMESVFNKVAGLTLATLLKSGSNHRCFPVRFAKFLRIPSFTEHLSAKHLGRCNKHLHIWLTLLHIYGRNPMMINITEVADPAVISKVTKN